MTTAKPDNKKAPLTVTRISPTHIRACLEVRGRIFAITWACQPGDEPTEAALRSDYRASRQDWKPFDQSTGAYLGKGGSA